MQRKKINVFSLSFLDCICCGLGAVILLFVIVNAKSAVRRDEVTSNLHGEVDRIEKEVLYGKKGLVELRNTLQETRDELAEANGLSRRLLNTIEEKKEELAHYEYDTLATKEHINRLKTDLKSMEEGVKRLEGGSKARDDYGSKLRRFSGTGDRQYLTDLKMGGKRILILVDASASMLDDTIVGVIRRRNLSEQEKIQSEKWQQAVATVDWLTTQLPLTSQFQIYSFNETATPVISGTHGDWLNAEDVDKLNETVLRLKKIVPQKGTSLVNAFKAIEEMKPAPDNIFLLVDSLPTMGPSKTWEKRVSGKKRLSLFNKALRKLSPNVPINIIMYPMEGDPIAVSAYWRLAILTRGSFFSPSRDWP